MVPTGPERGALLNENRGCAESATTLLIGATGTGWPITIGVNTSKAAVDENGPVFAPSSARACQKYVRPVASASGRRMLVWLAPGGIPSRENTLLAKLTSAAISNTYVRGRAPDEDEFTTVRTRGC